MGCRTSALAVLALCCVAGAQAGDARSVRIGSHVFQVEVADTPHQRERGLMARQKLPADGGMLFVFEQEGRYCFWMRNTPLPLSIAFIDAGGRIANLADMHPHSDTLHCPATDVRYALEVAQGEFERRGITPGKKVLGLP